MFLFRIKYYDIREPYGEETSAFIEAADVLEAAAKFKEQYPLVPSHLSITVEKPSV